MERSTYQIVFLDLINGMIPSMPFQNVEMPVANLIDERPSTATSDQNTLLQYHHGVLIFALLLLRVMKSVR